MLCQTCLVSRYSSSPASPELAADAGLLVAAPLGLRHVRVVVVDPDRAHPQPGRDPLRPCRRPGSRPRRPGRRCCRWRSATASSSSRNVSTVSTGPNDSSWVTDIVAGAAVEDRSAGSRSRRPARGRRAGLPPQRSTAPSASPRATYASTLSRCAALVSGPVSAFSSNGPPSRIRPARSTSRVDELVVDRLLDDQPGAGRADLAGVQEDRGQREVEGDLEVGVGEHDVGVLAAELERDLLHRRRRRRP